MTETYNAATTAALSASVYREVLFLKIAFPGYTFLATNLSRDYVLSGETYSRILRPLRMGCPRLRDIYRWMG